MPVNQKTKVYSEKHRTLMKMKTTEELMLGMSPTYYFLVD